MNSIEPWRGLHISNLLTYLSLFLSTWSLLAMTTTGQAEFFVMGLSASFLLDAFDGRFARLFKSRSPFVSSLGSHLDTIVDFAVFGLIPCLAILILRLTMGVELFFLILSLCLFVGANLTRLAVFQEYSSKTDHFIGVPTTVSGLFLAGFIFVFDVCLKWEILAFGGLRLWLTVFVLMALSAMMLSSVKIKRPGLLQLGLIALLALGLIGSSLYSLSEVY